MSEPESDGSGYISGGSNQTLKSKQKEKAQGERQENINAPKLTPEELDVVRRTIMHTTIPSWIDHVPHNLGAASHGSLKAAEWLILYKVYYTIALIPLWTRPGLDAENNNERNQVTALLTSNKLTYPVQDIFEMTQDM